ncbi:MAG: hypothetical protein JSR96_13180 [Proteobacteria bacterium]|nr:hypothetical protein [Pseudomonadota bacterium]
MSDSETDRYDDEVAGFRQPMVTSVGIILGFLLGFLANWAAESDKAPALATPSDYALAGTLGISMVCFVVVLFRLLDNRVVERPGLRYRTTLRLYMASMTIAGVGLAAALIL